MIIFCMHILLMLKRGGINNKLYKNAFNILISYNKSLIKYIKCIKIHFIHWMLLQMPTSLITTKLLMVDWRLRGNVLLGELNKSIWVNLLTWWMVLSMFIMTLPSAGGNTPWHTVWYQCTPNTTTTHRDTAHEPLMRLLTSPPWRYYIYPWL